MTVGKFLRGAFAHALEFWIWCLEEWAERPHTRRYDAPDPRLYSRKQPTPEATCDHGLTLDRPCRECDETR